MVGKWRAFICPYQSGLVIHIFPKKQETKGEISSSISQFYPSTKPLPSMEGVSQYSKQFVFTTVLWNKKNRNLTLNSNNTHGVPTVHRRGSRRMYRCNVLSPSLLCWWYSRPWSLLCSGNLSLQNKKALVCSTG